MAGLAGGPERTRTACQARSHIEPVSERSDQLLGSQDSNQFTTHFLKRQLDRATEDLRREKRVDQPPFPNTGDSVTSTVGSCTI
jgi:hypothetical protein